MRWTRRLHDTDSENENFEFVCRAHHPDADCTLDYGRRDVLNYPGRKCGRAPCMITNKEYRDWRGQ